MGRLAFILVLVASLWGSQARAQVSESDIARKQLELGVFALKQAGTKGSNLTLSPYSIHAALMLLRLGARGPVAEEIDGKLLPAPFGTALQVAYADLNSKVALSNGMVSSTLANSVWLQSGSSLRKDYLESSSRIFAAEPRNVDFGTPEKARETINGWVSSKTNALIPSLLPPGTLSKDSTCVLVNALYFKSAWLSSFAKGATQEQDFWMTPSISSKVPMMSNSGSMGYFETERWQGVHLPYQAFDFFFVVLVPKERLAVSDVVGDLSPDLFERSFQESEFTKVDLSLPRFKARFSTDLVQDLKRYGLVNLQNGDYSGISSQSEPRVGSVVHEAVVSVYEAGTEAAAATAVILAGGMRPDTSTPIRVNVDRPFAFAIVHRASKAPLFLGVVGDPR